MWALSQKFEGLSCGVDVRDHGPLQQSKLRSFRILFFFFLFLDFGHACTAVIADESQLPARIEDQ
jgi:hypothetical protein